MVVISYYINSRATFKNDIAKIKSNKFNAIKEYGLNKGSQGYGKRKGGKVNFELANNFGFSLKKNSKDNTLRQVAYLVWKEVKMFVKATTVDRNHTRNLIYLMVSVYASSENGMLFNALLLIDIINKIKTLSQVLSIFNENKIALASTLLLFGVMLYIAAFYSFITFRHDFGNSTQEEDYDGDFQMYCRTLVECLTTTINIGIRAGGGLGDALGQPEMNSPTYSNRYVFDFLFFMLINIILMNIFFGIIIDSFADKRAHEAEVEIEVQDSCFICGIQKSTFEIENASWKTHIFCDHNLHSYMSFLIYVKCKSSSECTGIEKYVKQCLSRGIIDYFPIGKCLAIRNGASIE